VTVLFKERLLRSTVIAGAVALGASAAQAQAPIETQQAAEAEAPASERITVTGSRIVRQDFTASNPVTTLDSGNIQSVGATNLTDFLSDTPALINSFDQQESANTGNAGQAGLNLLDLRGLGENRTLVLVDGRRHVAGRPGTAAVDINTIPVGLVERVEVLTGGASAVYGSDGVSGVVNFILRKDFEGTEVRAQYGAAEGHTAARSFISATHGRNFMNNRLNLTASVEFAQEDALNATERSYLVPGRRLSLAANPDYTGAPGEFQNIPLADGRYVDTARGGAVTTYNTSNSPFDIGFVGDGSPWQHGAFRSGTGFVMIGGSGTPLDDFVDQVLPGQDRYSVNFTGNFELTPQHRLFGEAKFNLIETTFQAQPIWDYFLPMQGDNAFMPESIRADLLPAGSILPAEMAPNGVAFIGRDHFDLGFRNQDIERETIRTVAGIEGEFDAMGGLAYETSFVYGRSEQRGASQNDRISERFLAAIDAVVDPATGNVVCRSDINGGLAPSVTPGMVFPGDTLGRWDADTWGTTFTPGANSGCVPANIFGENISPEAAAWINQTNHSRAVLEQYVVSGFVSGSSAEYFSLPGGPVSFAVGGEYRHERSDSYPSAIQRLGDDLGSDLTTTSRAPKSGGSFAVSEVFIEAEAPILADLPFIQDLTVDAAYRYSDYSNVGGHDTWKVGGRWTINDLLMLRGTAAQAVRAPNVNELFNPRLQTFGTISDPCTANNFQAGTDLRAGNCADILAPFGVNPADFNDPTSASRVGSTGGNPDLSPETATTFTYGAVFTPTASFFQGFSLSADYYDIEIEDAILTFSAQRVAEQCVDLPQPNQFCGAITRDPATGRILNFESFPVNLAERRVRGWDVAANYAIDPAEFLGFDRDLGSLQLTAGANRTFSLELRESPDANPDERAGYPEAPKWTFVGNAAWSYDRLSLNYRYTWIDQTRRQTPERMSADPDWVAPEYVWFSERSVHDISARYQLTDMVGVYGGINNFTNQQPDLGSSTEPVGALGRFFYVGASASF
jgi:iron complex outermembrane recepter protein